MSWRIGRTLRQQMAAAVAASILGGTVQAQERPYWAEAPARSTALATPSLDVWMLNVGQGSCVYVDCPDRRAAILIDCGSRSSGPGVSTSRIMGWLTDETGRDERLQLIVSHGDADHFSLLPQLDASRFQRARLGGGRADFTPIAAWLDAIETAGGAVELYAPDTFSIDDASYSCAPARVDVLIASHWQGNRGIAVNSHKNADSAVVRLSYDGAAIVMTGDAEGSTEQAALRGAFEAGVDLAMPTVLMGSHHGAGTARSNAVSWVDAWRPQVGAFSATVRAYGHPTCEVVGRFARHARPAPERFPLTCGTPAGPNVRNVETAIVSTQDNGTVLFRLAAGRVTILCERLTPACDADLETVGGP